MTKLLSLYTCKPIYESTKNHRLHRTLIRLIGPAVFFINFYCFSFLKFRISWVNNQKKALH